MASPGVKWSFLYFLQSSLLASSLSRASPMESTSPLSLLNNLTSLGARVHRSLCMQARFPPPNTLMMFCCHPQGLNSLTLHPVGCSVKEEFMYQPHKWQPGKYWFYPLLISLRAERALDLLGILLNSSLM